jgi:hypothetical protein
MKNLNNSKVGYDALDMNDPRFVSQYSDLVKDNITGIGMSPEVFGRFNAIDGMVKGNEVYKAKLRAENNAWVATDWWNEEKSAFPD